MRVHSCLVTVAPCTNVMPTYVVTWRAMQYHLSTNSSPFCKASGVYMFINGVGVPFLTLIFLLNDIPENTYFTLFNETEKNLYQLEKDNIVGVRLCSLQNTTRKGSPNYVKPCRSTVGYDTNALYLWYLIKDMPTGWYTRRREENDFRPA